MHSIFELLMDWLVEFVVDRLIELIAKIFELAAWLIRTAVRFVRWIIELRRGRTETIYFASGKSTRDAAEGSRTFYSGGRRRERRRRSSCEIG
jgi:hypothetical protein